MTYKQALNYNQKWTAQQAFNDLERYLLRDEPPEYKAVALGMQAVEKQIPKKVWYKSKIGAICPNCDKELDFSVVWRWLFFKRIVRIRHTVNHCRHCGQALDWSDTK